MADGPLQTKPTRRGRRGSVALRTEALEIMFEAAAARSWLQNIETRLEIVVARGRDNPHFGGLPAEDIYLSLAGATRALAELRPTSAYVERYENEIQAIEA